MIIQTDVVIIGDGLSGLAIADHLQSVSIDYQLFEFSSNLADVLNMASSRIVINGVLLIFELRGFSQDSPGCMPLVIALAYLHLINTQRAL